MVFSFIKRNNHNNNKQRKISIQKDQFIYNDIIKILLLGTGESGKTTIMKQMKILHIRNYTDKERKLFIPEIRQTLHESAYGVATILQTNNDTLDEYINNCCSFIFNWGEQGPSEFIQDYFEKIFILWQTNQVQHIFTTYQHSQLIDNAKYFFTRLSDISSPLYVPTVQDILHSRKRTTDIQKLTFRMKIPRCYGKIFQEFCMYDVGGQQAERRKWIQVFAGTQAVLFVVGCSEFDQTLRENNEINRLQESLQLFSELWTSRFLLSASFLLFLNKQDILERKITNGSSIQYYFPEFQQWSQQFGTNLNSYEQAKQFIYYKFSNIIKTPRDINIMGTFGHRLSRGQIIQECYCHYTTATDTNQIKRIFEHVHTTIHQQIMKSVQLH